MSCSSRRRAWVRAATGNTRGPASVLAAVRPGVTGTEGANGAGQRLTTLQIAAEKMVLPYFSCWGMWFGLFFC